MPRTQNCNNLSKEDICKFYEFVCEYEKDIKHRFGSYNIDDQRVKQFCLDNSIAFGKRPVRQYSFVYEAYKPKGQLINDKAHHLLRHIRNSFCHGLVTKKGKMFSFRDYNKLGNISMDGQIREDLLWCLLDVLHNSKRP